MSSGCNQSCELVLGIDGGGSKTIAWLGRIDDRGLSRIGEGHGGPANPRAVGFEIAFASLLNSIQSAFHQAGLKPQIVDRACLCLAGAGRSQEREAVLRWAHDSGWTRQLLIVSEAEAVLAALEPMGAVWDQTAKSCSPPDTNTGRCPVEVALICGTGSLAWGRDRSLKRETRCGGWGFLLGDEGSGFWLGQQILKIACRAADGRSQDQCILDSVLDHLDLTSSDEIVAWCYQNPGSRERIAGLAPLAFQNSHISAVDELLSRGAFDLAEMIDGVLQRLGTNKSEVVFAGSVVANQPQYRARILQFLGEHFGFSGKDQVINSPVAGALRLAACPPKII
jgi:N-acetylglucosamine kinase-like BadF-type ATPase